MLRVEGWRDGGENEFSLPLAGLTLLPVPVTVTHIDFFMLDLHIYIPFTRTH